MPARVVPEVGKVPENTTECPQNDSWVVSQTSRAGFQIAIGCGRVGATDVLPYDVGGADDGDCLAHLPPQVGAGALGHAGALPGVAEVLTGSPAADEVNGLDGRPVHGRHVA